MTTAMADSPNIELPDGYEPGDLIETSVEAVETYQGHDLPRAGTTLGVGVDGQFIDLVIKTAGDPRSLLLTLSRDDARRIFGPLFVHEHVAVPADLPTGAAWRRAARAAHGSNLECASCDTRALEAIARVRNARDRAGLMAQFATPAAELGVSWTPDLRIASHAAAA